MQQALFPDYFEVRFRLPVDGRLALGRPGVWSWIVCCGLKARVFSPVGAACLYSGDSATPPPIYGFRPVGAVGIEEVEFCPRIGTEELKRKMLPTNFHGLKRGISGSVPYLVCQRRRRRVARRAVVMWSRRARFAFFAGDECVVNLHEKAVEQDPGYEVLHDV